MSYRLTLLSGYILLYTTLAVFAVLAYILLACRRKFMQETSTDAQQDFYAARRRFTWPWIGMSYFASVMGSWVFFAMPEVGTFLGWWGIIGYAVGCVAPLAVILIIGAKLREQLERTVGPDKGYAATDWIFMRFGRPIQVYVVLVSILIMWISIVSEYTAVGQVVEMFTGIPSWLTCLSVAFVTLSYTLLSGLPLSILTDMTQGMAAVGLIIFAVIVTSTKVVISAPNWTTVANWSSLGFQSLIVLILATLSAELLDMAVWQRVWAAKDDLNLRLGLLLGGVLVFFILMGFGVLGMVAEAQDRARAVPHLTTVPYTKALAFFDLLEALPGKAIGCVVVLSVCLTTSSVDTVQSALLSVFAAEFVKRRWSLHWARVLLLMMNVPAVVLAMSQMSMISLFLIGDLVAATVCLPVFCGLHSAVTALAVVSGVIAGNLTILVCGWSWYGTFVGGFRMYVLPGGLYSSMAMTVFLAVMLSSLLVTLGVSVIQRKLFPATEGFLANGRYVASQELALNK
ncbi:hypothetical protein FOL47_009765 [Perkinsus chesapeaki]|uniref:Uncharacterized protein n=1 Tax=Perkinsus chesapeaki TaxID=330153 RepID=A0A7J6L6P6_PERCH|nr:hypothetical protein FOL47_009765 [Perkinsus chesapeaki]